MKVITRAGNQNCHQGPKGFTIRAIFVVVAVISSVASAGYLFMTDITGSVRAGKLRLDVVTLNNAVRTYLTHGGNIPPAADAQTVFATLKSTSDGPSSRRMAGIKSSLLNARVRGTVIVEAGPERAVWNESKARFEITTSGSGFQAFDLGGDVAAPVAEASRDRTPDPAAQVNRVREASTTASESTGPRETVAASAELINPGRPSTLTRLAPPDFSLPGALYDYSAFSPTLSVSLTDRNMPGESRIFYSIANGPWLEYQGTSLKLPPQFTTTVRAYAAAVNGANYEDSDPITQKYETIYFTGTSAGNFHEPTGEDRLMSNLPPGKKSPMFIWGDPVAADKRRNELTFTGSSFANIAPDQEFKLGTLSYVNGTTCSGTNATTIQVAIDLHLTKPGVKETLNFTLNLLSTPNNGRDSDAGADYVYIPNVSTNFRTTIKGHTFALVLRFGEHSPDGFTTIDTFRAHEGMALSGTIYGRLTAAK